MFSILGVFCVKFFLVQDQTDVGQSDPVIACAHCNLDCNHTPNKKTKLLALVKTKKNKNSGVISNCFMSLYHTKLVPDNGTKNLIGRERDVYICTPMCASARVASSNIVYLEYGYRSTGTSVLNTEIGL